MVGKPTLEADGRAVLVSIASRAEERGEVLFSRVTALLLG
jgi:hypothetical protein